jgi:hypothetical protein
MVREKFPKLIYVFSLGKKKLYLICIGSSALHATWATILLVEALSSHPHESVTKEMLVSNFGRSLQPYYTGKVAMNCCLLARYQRTLLLKSPNSQALDQSPLQISIRRKRKA